MVHAEADIVISDLPPITIPRSWFALDWTLAADRWVASAEGRTLDAWCNLPHEWRCAFAEHECTERRARGVPDPEEKVPHWAFKTLAGAAPKTPRVPPCPVAEDGVPVCGDPNCAGGHP